MSEELNIQNSNVIEKANSIENENNGGDLLQEESEMLREIYELPLGKELNLEMTYKITAGNKSNFIVVAGPSDCGKTTLITTIYQKFQKGSVGNYNFAGSETLQGFEQRAFLTRIDSNMGEAQTPKTRRGVTDILHLRIFDSANKKFTDLLITDFSGEDYSSAIGNVSMMKSEFGVIRSANNILIIIDGEKISHTTTKFAEIENALDLLKTIIDAGLLSKFACVEVSVSKYDVLVSTMKDDSTTEKLLNYIRNRFEERFKNSIKFLNFSKMAAMPNETKEIPVAYGLDKILKSWVEGKNGYDKSVNDVVLQENLFSQFNLFKMRLVEVTE